MQCAPNSQIVGSVVGRPVRTNIVNRRFSGGRAGACNDQVHPRCGVERFGNTCRRGVELHSVGRNYRRNDERQASQTCKASSANQRARSGGFVDTVEVAGSTSTASIKVAIRAKFQTAAIESN